MSVRNKPTQVNSAYDRLKIEILNSTLPPGFQAPEPEIASRLGMSRTPVREALIRLEADGLVDLVPRRGARVRPLSKHDMLEIYDLLCVLEPLAVRHLCSGGPMNGAPKLKSQEARLMDMIKAEEAGDVDAWAEAELEFRRELIGLGGNHRLVCLLESLFSQLYRGRLVLLRLMQPPEIRSDIYRGILEAVREGDGEKGACLMLECCERARSNIEWIFNLSRLSQV